MIGMSWGETQFRLTYWQWGALFINTLVWIGFWQGYYSGLIAIAIILPTLALTFSGEPISLDVALLFRESQKLRGLSWENFCTEFYKHSYLEFQTPFIPFLCAHSWIYADIQYYWSLLIYGGICFAAIVIFGRNAGLLCATPLWGITLMQPSTDSALVVMLLSGWFCLAQNWLLCAAILFGLAYLIKPLVLLLLPFLLIHLKWYLILTCGIWIGYIVLSLCTPWGKQQIHFLLQQFYICPMPIFRQIRNINRAKRRLPPITTHSWRLQEIERRQKEILLPMLTNLPVFLFPVYLQPPSLSAIILSLAILGGYSNVKYFLLSLLCYFPINYGNLLY